MKMLPVVVVFKCMVPLVIMSPESSGTKRKKKSDCVKIPDLFSWNESGWKRCWMTKREFDDRTKGLIHTDCDECVRKAKRQWIHSQEEKGKGWQEQSDLKEKGWERTQMTTRQAREVMMGRKRESLWMNSLLWGRRWNQSDIILLSSFSHPKRTRGIPTRKECLLYSYPSHLVSRFRGWWWEWTWLCLLLTCD